MTARVRSRAILSSKLKIRKNVIKDEIDHNGAYLCVCECQKKLNLSYLVYFISNSGQKVRSNFSEKWRLFCFVLSTSTSKLELQEKDRSFLRDRPS